MVGECAVRVDDHEASQRANIAPILVRQRPDANHSRQHFFVVVVVSGQQQTEADIFQFLCVDADIRHGGDRFVDRGMHNNIVVVAIQPGTQCFEVADKLCVVVTPANQVDGYVAHFDGVRTFAADDFHTD